MQELPEGFEETFGPSIRAYLLDALVRAYNSVCEHHRPELGFDESTFGYNLYRLVVFELSQSAKQSSGLYTVKTRTPRFRLQASHFEVGCYRVGRSATEDIWTSFPGNDDAAPALLEQQLWLPNVEKESSIKKAKNLILAHLGNFEDGLGAVYLCVPSRVERDRIAGWAFAHLLWKQGDQMPSSVRPSIELVPEETVPEPQIGKIRKTMES